MKPAVARISYYHIIKCTRMTWEFSKSQKAKVIGRLRETIFQQDKLQYKILIDLNWPSVY